MCKGQAEMLAAFLLIEIRQVQALLDADQQSGSQPASSAA